MQNGGNQSFIRTKKSFGFKVKVKMINYVYTKFKDGKYFSRALYVDNVSTVEEEEGYYGQQF